MREEAILDLAKWILRDLEESSERGGSGGAGKAAAIALAVVDKLDVNAINAINGYVEIRKALDSLTPTDTNGFLRKGETDD